MSRLIFPVGMGLILLLAGMTLIYRIASFPHGFLDAEAANGLLARTSSGHGSALLTQVGSRSALLAGLIALAGRPLGFDIFTARLGAALAGLGTILFTSLWLRRVFGSIWGVIGGLILAGSFWFILFSRVALSPITGALALSLLLWCSAEALARGYRPDALFWFAGAGIAAGIGYISDPAMRIVPVLLLVALISATHEHGIVMRHNEIVGWLLAILIGLVVAGPFIRHTTGTPSLLTFWTGTLGLPGSAVASWNEALRNYGTALAKVGWPLHTSLDLNLPSTPLLGAFILPWAIVGLAVALRQIRNRLVVTALLWALILLIPAAAITPVHPGRLLTILPLLVALPVAGMRFLIHHAPTLRYQFVVGALILVMLASNAAWSDWTYFSGWASEAETSQAFSAGVSESLTAIGQIPGDEPVLYSTNGYENVRQYLGSGNEAGAHQRFDFDGAQMLPFPLETSGYLISPESTPIAQPLLQILGQTSLPDLNGAHYNVYRLDERAREKLPLSIPTDTFADGTRFLGHQLIPSSASELSVVVAWQLPGDGKAHTFRVRLRPVDDHGPTQIVDVSLPGDLLDQPYDLLRLVHLKAPAPGVSADLSVSLLNASGKQLTASGLDTDGYLFLNRYTFSR